MRDGAIVIEDIPLQGMDEVTSTTSTNQEGVTQELPPADGGRDAWQFLAAAFLIETVIWGFPNSYGVLLEYHLRSPLGDTAYAQTLVPLVGTLNSGMMYLSSVGIIFLNNRWPKYRQICMWVGTFLCVFSLLLASFATNTLHLILSEGIGYGLGGSLVYFPTISYLTEWFFEKRGLANGIIFAGTALGGLILPFILNVLLEKYGMATTLRVLAVGMAALLIPSLPFIKSRYPPAGANAPRPSSLGNLNALKQPRFWIYIIGNTLQGLSFFLPGLFLPSYAKSLSLTSTQSAGALAAMNSASIVSRLGMGILSDRFSPHLLGSVTGLITTFVILVIWGVASSSLTPLIIFALSFGIFGGGWSSLYLRICGEYSDSDQNTANTLYGAVSFSRGLGNVLSAPVSAGLLYHSIGADGSIGYGVDSGSYAGLILFCGLMMGGASIIETGMEVERRHRRRNE